MKKEINVPNHVAIILDGNGRWAKKRGQIRTFGHYHGAINIFKTAEACIDRGIKYLTVFCFSTENWKRPAQEVEYLMNTPVKLQNQYMSKLENSNIKIKVIGKKDRINVSLRKLITTIEDMTKDKTGITLTLCIDYGSQDEITTAVKAISQDVLDGKIEIKDITPITITNNLYTKDLPPLDLMIRTSGECRLSNFLLWQLAYSELYFTDVFWPDFNAKELDKAILSYSSRNRKFGGLNENK
ncbi:MAG: isoprenyl transferase [Acholeplasmatales bacterium]|nr:isoprenyl transferase [Acholeplasmatales bacterium]